MQPDTISLALQITISCVTLACEWLKGNKWPHVWKLALASQVLWVVWIVYAGNWGLLPLTVFLTIMFTRNALKWHREDSKPMTSCTTRKACVKNGLCDGRRCC